MKTYLIMNVRFPTEKAHGWQIAKMMEALSTESSDVHLVIPDRVNAIKESPEAYYELKKPISIIRLPVIDWLSIPLMPRRIAFAIMEWSFCRAVASWAKKQPDESAFVFTRDHFLAARFRHAGWKLAFEAHDISQNFFSRHKTLATNVDLFVMTNSWKRGELIRSWGKDLAPRTIVLPNGIDIEAYRSLPEKAAARRSLGWAQDGRYAVYTGHFYGWKGVYVLAQAAAKVATGIKIVMVGGTKEDFTAMQKYVEEHGLRDRVMLVPHVPHAEVLAYLVAADCLLLPNSGTSWNSMYTTSPIKLWEYLAAKRPVVVSDLPSLRELVSDREVRFVRPDDPEELAHAIDEVASGGVSVEARVSSGFRLAEEHTWQSRAKKLLAAAV